MITGNLTTRQVFINGILLNPERSQKIWNHSPDGFAWGYCGSGPAQLALAILLEFIKEENIVICLYQDFKFDVIADLKENFELSIDAVVFISNFYPFFCFFI